MKKNNYLFIGLMLIIGLAACNEDFMTSEDLTVSSLQTTLTTTVYNVDGSASDVEVCGTQTYTLWAGQTINAGTLVVSNDTDNLYVTYNTTGVFNNLHLWVGTDFTLLPTNPRGIPVPGSFPYKFDATGLTSYTFTIPLGSISFYETCGNVIYVVAHAETLVNGNKETAFGGDIPVNVSEPGRWLYYAAYTTVCCETTPPPPSYERLGTSFAKGGYVFTTDKKSNPENLPSLKLTRNRWGWAINLTSNGTTTYNLWVGAGLNLTSKGINVGTATITYNGTDAEIKYDLLEGYSLEEVHVYAGDLRPATIAPGQYGFLNYFDPYLNDFDVVLPVSDTNGDGVWFILHAVVWGPGVVNL